MLSGNATTILGVSEYKATQDLLSKVAETVFHHPVATIFASVIENERLGEPVKGICPRIGNSPAVSGASELINLECQGTFPFIVQ